MKVKAIVPRGYCKGVVHAIKTVCDNASSDQPIYILGMIVHNQYIVDALKLKNVHTIEMPKATRLQLLEQIDHGTIVITAHGASKEVFSKAKAKGLNVIDATCSDVYRTHKLIHEKLDEGFEIIYIGKNGHPEAEGAIAINPNRIHLIEKKEDVDKLEQGKNYCLTNQTTMSLYDVINICEYTKEKLEHVLIEKEICNATKIRQEAINNIEEDIDVVFIVGDPNSNNTRKLAQIAGDKINTVYMIESVQDIQVDMLLDKNHAAVSSGASTPTYLTNQVIQYLRQFDKLDVSTHQTPKVILEDILK